MTMNSNPNSAVTESQAHGYAHPGFPMHGFPTPAFPPIQNYPMTNYPMPAPMYMPPYGYPFAMPGATQAMQPNSFPAPAFMMQNYPMPNQPMPAPMYAPPYGGYPFAMPAPQNPRVGANYGRKRQHSQVSDPISNPDEAGDAGIPNVDPNAGDLPADLDTPER